VTESPELEYAAELREILGLRGVPAVAASGIVREVQSHVADSGECAADVQISGRPETESCEQFSQPDVPCVRNGGAAAYGPQHFDGTPRTGCDCFSFGGNRCQSHQRVLPASGSLHCWSGHRAMVPPGTDRIACAVWRVVQMLGPDRHVVVLNCWPAHH
jgi:hypothetical protein